MANDEVRARMLRILYDFQMNNPRRVLSADELAKSFPDVPQNLFDANLIYLRDAYLVEGRGELGRVGPRDVRIAKLGIDVVERPELFSQKYSINFLNVGTNYGQVAQASQEAAIAQTQAFSSFDDVRLLIESHKELRDEERKEIYKTLLELETLATKGGLTKNAIEKAKQALARYGWLIPPLIQVLTKALGLS